MVAEYTWDCIKEEFEKGKITPEKMNCIADMLGPLVSEKHARRDRCDESGMKAILSDWDFFEPMYIQSKLKRLVTVFKDPSVRLLPLAKKLGDIDPDPKPCSRKRYTYI